MDAERLAQSAASGGLPGRYTATRTSSALTKCLATNENCNWFQRTTSLTMMTSAVPSSPDSAPTREIARASFNTISCTCNRSDLVGIPDTSQAAGRPRFPWYNRRVLTQAYLLLYCAHILV